MEWNSKMPWDLAELEANAETNMGSMVGSSSSGLAAIHGSSSGRLGLDCSVDLKLGGLGDFGSGEKWKDQQQRALNAGSSASPSGGSGSSKRARAPSGGGSQNASCLVDGCRADLSSCREYHRRHKVCEAHSKTRIVMIGGQEQRFCQQCSRFHSLAEFDEEKRSCRKRLDGHNRRRRKPQPESIGPGGLFTNHQGHRFSSYSQMFPTGIPDPSWPVIVKTEEEPIYPHHQPMHFLDCQQQHFSSSFTRGKHFPFLQDSDRAALAPTICQPLLNTISSAESSSSKIFSLDSDCALSLLSSPPQTSSINLGQIVPTADRIPVGQPLLNYGGQLGLGRFSGSHQASGFSLGMEDEQMAGGAVLVSDTSEHEMSCQGMFGVGGEESSDGGPHALPFSW